jgi:amidohydrolase
LRERRDQIHGTVKFVFQPAEEGLGGAERMLAEGVLDDPAVDYTLAMHLWNERPTGWVGAPAGALMAGADIFKVRIEGHGGHGALPQETADPVVATAQIISALQTVVSRNISPLEPAVISVCQLHAGNAFNVIPQAAEFSGTFRTFSPESREIVIERFKEIVDGVARSMGCTASVDIQRLTPAVINEPQIAERVQKAAANIPMVKIENGYHTMISEDMAYMMERVPGCYVLIGSASSGDPVHYGHHSPKFDFDEAALTNAVAVMTSAALELLK